MASRMILSKGCHYPLFLRLLSESDRYLYSYMFWGEKNIPRYHALYKGAFLFMTLGGFSFVYLVSMIEIIVVGY